LIDWLGVPPNGGAEVRATLPAGGLFIEVFDFRIEECRFRLFRNSFARFDSDWLNHGQERTVIQSISSLFQPSFRVPPVKDQQFLTFRPT
jgi:hypothetical protein